MVNPYFHGHPQHDTAFVILDDLKLGMEGIEVE
jgi:hypothetical protein